MSGQSKLEEIAILKRKELIAGNTYNSASDANKYSATHTRAMSDNTTPVNGKGTGVFLDTYNGGGSLDINGSSDLPGSGRIKNKAANEYNDNKSYKTPDMSLNVGQVNI